MNLENFGQGAIFGIAVCFLIYTVVAGAKDISAKRKKFLPNKPAPSQDVCISTYHGAFMIVYGHCPVCNKRQ